MSQAIPTRHPAVVLRSHFAMVRALLVAALIAVIGLTTALVFVANDDDHTAVQHSAEALGSLRYGGFNPATGRPEAAPVPRAQSAMPARRLDGATDAVPVPGPSPLARYDGGPEEGTRGIVRAAPEPGVRYDGGPEEGSRGIVSAASEPGVRYDGGPEEGSRGPGLSTD